MMMFDTDHYETYKLISKLVNKNSCAYDLVSNKILKATIDIITPYLVVLFNKCIKEGVFPNSFKLAEVIPLFKGGDRQDPDRYRPISLLPTIGKLFEKILSIRVLKFLSKHEIVSKHQIGFRAKFSTDYAFVDIYDKLINNLDKGLSSCAIFLDLAKAFDSVDHRILLKKLDYYGIRGKALQLFESYLDSRSQYVKVNNVTSSCINILFGVPQGSILGPLLFLIFINDLPDATNLYVKLFADDTFLCTENEDFAALENEVNLELEKVFVWLASNKLTLNIDKCKFMIISNKCEIPNLSVKLDGISLESCESYKYLGVFIDKNLNWEPHIDYITQKISKACGALAKLRHCIDTSTLINVYHALVYSYLRYGIIIWGNDSQNALKPLVVVVNRAIRIIGKLPFGNVELNPAFKQLKLLQVPKKHTIWN